MKRPSFLPKMPVLFVTMGIALIFAAFAFTASAQESQLSLADILIALRSKKVTLTDRNKILTEAIATRGTTFTLTPEIEKELTETGANKTLLESIRQRPQIAKVNLLRPRPAEIKAKGPLPKIEPVVQPPVQDAAFFEKRAQESVAKGDLDTALVDYTKAAEIDATFSVLMGRGRTYTAKKTYLLAIADFTKVIDLDSKNAEAFAARAEAQEKQGNAALALDDYKRAFELDPKIEAARAAVENDKAEQANLVKETKPIPQPVSEAPVLPEYVDLGLINEARATKMVRPVYPPAALRSGYGGQVVFELELDSKGNVTKAKAVSGNMFLRKPCEDAAERSQFKPATVGTVAIKAKARIVYDFIARR